MNAEIDSIDFRQIVARYSFAEHATRADLYFASLDCRSPVARKPFAAPGEAAEICGGLAAILPDLLLFPGARVLDFGAGTCWMSRLLALLGCEVTAADVSRKALELGERLIRSDVLSEQLNVRFVTLDGPKLPFENEAFDRIVCFDALHHVPDQKHAIGEFARVLRNGGVAALHEPGPKHSQSAQSQYEMRMYDVIEADVYVDQLFEAALSSGITRAELAVYSTRTVKTGVGEFDKFMADPGNSAVGRCLVKGTAAGLENRRTFFLYKGDPLARMDSRLPQGLMAEINLSAEADEKGIHVRGVISNTGSTVWLPSFAGIGSVNLGVHLHDADGRLIDRDYGRFGLSSESVAPGNYRSVDIEIPYPEGLRQFALVVDLVAEGITWFEISGGTPVRFAVDLSAMPVVRRLVGTSRGATCHADLEI